MTEKVRRRAAREKAGRERSVRGAGSRDEARQRILATVDSIPRGRVATYGDVAREAGLPGRARLVGRVLAELSGTSGLPWQRVVNASGRISLAGRGARRQRERLRREGVELDARGRVDLARFAWRA